MLLALGFILPIVYYPGVEGPLQWYLLGGALPAATYYLAWHRDQFPNLTLPVYLCLAFGVWVACSLIWAYDVEHANIGISQACIWAMSFILGAQCTSLRSLWRGLALGLTISTGFAIAQTIGYSPVPVAVGAPGLLFNPTVSSAVCALVLLALDSEGDWIYTLGPILGLILSGARGGWLILAVGLIARYIHILAALALILAANLIALSLLGPSDSVRLQVWSVAYRGLTLLGWGPTSFDLVYYHDPAGLLIHPQFVHNDYLQLFFEYGIGALFPISILAYSLTAHRAALWPLIVAFATLALFYFPLYHPLTAFIGMIALGRISQCFPIITVPIPTALRSWSLQ